MLSSPHPGSWSGAGMLRGSMITAGASLASWVIMDCRHEAGNDKPGVGFYARGYEGLADRPALDRSWLALKAKW
jgi:hypothetical protein